MDEWRVIEDIPGEFEIVDADGETIVMYVSQDDADQIVSDHNTRAALEAQVARYRASLQQAVDDNLHEGTCRAVWGGQGDGCTCWLKRAREALATAGPGGGGEGEGS